MSLTLSQITTEVALGLGRQDQVPNIPTWVNLAQERLSQLQHWRCFERMTTVAVSGTSATSLPIGIQILSSLMYLTTTGTSTPVWRTPQEFYVLHPNADTSPVPGEPTDFFVLGNTAYLYPYPVTGNLKWFYSGTPIALSQDVDVPELPYSELLVVATIIVAMRRLDYQMDMQIPKLQMFNVLLEEAKRNNAMFYGSLNTRMHGYQAGSYVPGGPDDKRADPFYGIGRR